MAVNSFNICKALIVRCILTCHVILCAWRVVVDLKSQTYWLLICGLCPLMCETCYTIVRRQGVEFTRFTPCFFFYLGAVLPGIWLLELDKTDLYITSKKPQLPQATNGTEESALLVISWSPKTWIIVIEEMLPYVMFLGRWILPRGRVRREELAELLFAFIEIAADIMEFFSLFDEDVIRSNKTLAYCILGIWSLAVLQFTMTVTVIHQPKKEKNFINIGVGVKKEQESMRIKHECYSIFLTIIMQDLPFAVMRLYTIINFNYINYSLIFFTSKNLIIISLLLYKVAALCRTWYFPDIETGHEEEARVRKEAEIKKCSNIASDMKSSLSSLDQVGVHVDNLYLAHEDLSKQNYLDESSRSVVRRRCSKCNKTLSSRRAVSRDINESDSVRTSESVNQKIELTTGVSEEVTKSEPLLEDKDASLAHISEHNNVPSLATRTSSVVVIEVGNDAICNISHDINKDVEQCKEHKVVTDERSKADITNKLKKVETDVSVLKALSPTDSVTFLLMSVITNTK